jgi:preprotein translocase subunit YajC
MNAQALQGFIVPIGFLVVFYLFIIRPQKKKEKEIREMRDGLRVGDSIITIGGIYGKVIKAKEDIITIEVGSSKTKLDVTRWAIGNVVKKNESKNNRKEKEETSVEENDTKDND